MKHLKKRALSMLLVLCFVMSLLPVLPAAATDGAAVALPKIYSTFEELKAEKGYQGGVIYRIDKDSDDENYVTVTIGVYKQCFDSSFFTLTYNTSVVELVQGNKQALVYDRDFFGNITLKDQLSVYKSELYTTDMAADKAYESTITSANMINGSTGLFLVEDADVNFGIVEKQEKQSGGLSIAVATQNSDVLSQVIGIYKKVTKVQSDTTRFGDYYYADMSKLETPGYLLSMKFHVIDSANLNNQTFGLRNEGGFTAGAGLDDTSLIGNTRICDNVRVISNFLTPTGSGSDTPDPSGETKEYTVTLADDQSMGGAVKAGTAVTVKVGDMAEQTVTVGEDGTIQFNGIPRETAQDLVIKVPGYVDSTTSVTLKPDGTIEGVDAENGIILTQQTTDVKLAVATLPAVVTLKAKGEGTVTAKMAEELPMSEATMDGEDKTVTLHGLPDGVYEYTIEEAGKEPVTKTLVVANSGLMSDVTDAAGGTTGKVTIVNAETNAVEATLTPDASTGTATADATQSGSAGAANINDPMYIVEGTWKEEASKVTGMTVKVYVKNTSALSGSFGMYVDKNVFAPATEVVVSDQDRIQLAGLNEESGIANPALGEGYVAFQWAIVDNGENGTVIDDGENKFLLATIELTLTDAAKKDDAYKTLVTKETVSELNFVGSTWEDQIKTAFAEYPERVAEYWRPLNAQNENPAEGSLRLNKDRAVNGGFFQTGIMPTGDAWQIQYQDTMTQFLYKTFSDLVPLTFKVQNNNEEPLKGATVVVTSKDGKVLGTVQTNENGQVTIPIKGQDVSYKVTLAGYSEATGDVAEADLGETVVVTLTSKEGHPVELASGLETTIELVGNKTAPNGEDYYFSLDAQPGYKWPGDKLPAADKLIIEMTGADGNSLDPKVELTATWNAAKNAYVISGEQIKDDEPTHKIVINLENVGENGPKPDTTGYKVTTTVGENGTVTFDQAGNGSTIKNGAGNATASTNGPATLIETLTAGVGNTPAGTTSAKYTFTPEEPYNSTGEDDPYNAYIIESVKVNGSELTLTDYQKIHGLNDFQLTGIDKDQSVVVTFAKAHVDKEDDVIDPVPTPEPTNKKANVTLVLSPYGEATSITVTGTDGTQTQPQDTTVNYEVVMDETNKTGSFTATFKGMEKVPQPDSSTSAGTADYIIDSVTVDGVKVNGDPAGTEWNTDTLTLNALKAGENHTVVVTFTKKPDEGKEPEPMFATLEIIRRAGEGTVEPMGTQTATIGLPVNVEITPATNYNLDQIDLTVPGAAVAEIVTKDAETTGSTSAYQVPALKAGKTVLGVSFCTAAAADRYQVKMNVVYGSEEMTLGKNATAATFKFVNADSGETLTYGPNGAGAVDNGGYQLSKPATAAQTYTFSLPAGTWNVQITKQGYLNYTIKGFTIAKNGETITAGTDTTGMDTKVESVPASEDVEATTIIYFGQKDDAAQKAVTLTIGNASWDGKVISHRDISQVSAGMMSIASKLMKLRADVDESGNVGLDDMTCVVNNYAARQVSTTYADFMTPAAQP